MERSEAARYSGIGAVPLLRQRLKPSASEVAQTIGGHNGVQYRMSQPLLRSQVPPRPEKRNGYLPSTFVQGHSADSGYLSSQSHRDQEAPIYENFQDLKPTGTLSSPGVVKSPTTLLRHDQRPRAKTPSRFETPVFVPAEIYNKPTNGSMQIQSTQNLSISAHLPDSSGVITYQELTVPLARIESGFGFRVIGGTEENSQVQCETC